MPASVVRTVVKVMTPPPFGFPPGPSGDAAIELGADPLAFISKAQLEHGDVVGGEGGTGCAPPHTRSRLYAVRLTPLSCLISR
jgi:hypothetical protein